MSQSKQIVFVETSIQIQRILAPRAERARVEGFLTVSSIQPVTSAYVWMEYQRSLIADFAYVHQIMGQYADWGALFEHVLDGSHAFRPRSAARCTQIIGPVYSASTHSYELARHLLSSQISDELKEKFWSHVVPLQDPITCDLVATGITRQRDQTYNVAASCRKDSAACHLPFFLNHHQAELRLVADYLAGHPHALKDQPRLERLLTAIIADPRAALGQNSCWPLGDLIIALQVPSDAALWTLDADFATLAEALGLSLYKP